MRYTNPQTTRNILQGLQASAPTIATELRRRLLLFEDLEFADPRGIQKLLKLTTLRDLALAMKGTSDGVLQNIAHNMSQRGIQDLRDEIQNLGPTPVTEIESARDRMMETIRRLIEKRELFIIRNGEGWVD